MLSKKLALEHIGNSLKGKRVLMRADFNVPIKDGKVADTNRIASTMPSIKYCLENGASQIVLMSHLGRPKGVRQEQFSLKPVLPALEDLVGDKVNFLEDCVGASIEKQARESKQKITLLENLRFHLAEEGKGEVNGEKVKADKVLTAAFRQSLSKMGDIFVNDAFGTAHRAHSSMVGIDMQTRAAGFLMKKELDYFAKVLEEPDRPLTVIMGGAKVKDKIQLILNMLDIVDEMVIGGGMAFTFNKVVHNANIGKSLFDEEGAKIVPEILKKAEEKGVKIHIPSDFVCGDKFEESAAMKVATIGEGVPENWMGLDIGPQTTLQYLDVVSRSKTIFWNGPQGVFEMPKFAKGSLDILEGVIKATKNGATSVIGGGDTVNLLKKMKGAKEQMSHVSTGGGASLELVEGK